MFLLLRQSSRLSTALQVWGGIDWRAFPEGRIQREDSALSPPNAWARWLSQESVWKPKQHRKAWRLCGKTRWSYISAQLTKVSEKWDNQKPLWSPQVLWYTAPQHPEKVGKHKQNPKQTKRTHKLELQRVLRQFLHLQYNGINNLWKEMESQQKYIP